MIFLLLMHPERWGEILLKPLLKQQATLSGIYKITRLDLQLTLYTNLSQKYSEILGFYRKLKDCLIQNLTVPISLYESGGLDYIVLKVGSNE